MTLSYRQAMESPCLSCQTSPCCTHLLLRKFRLGSLGDVDYVVYLANFPGILVDVDPAGSCCVYLSQACRFLDHGSGLCSVHSTPEQPLVCTHYNAHACRYRHGMTMSVNPERPLMDHGRAAWYADHVTFDDQRLIVALPDWDEMISAFGDMPLDRGPAPVHPPSRPHEEWRRIALGRRPAAEAPLEPRPFGDPAVSDPCGSCEAYCCSVLVFGRDVPEDAGDFDFFRYCLGFPSVELLVTDDGWALVVRATCRHLDGGRCGVHGQPERPLRCGYYDELKCTYRDHFGSAVPDDALRITRHEFAALAQTVVFDDRGRVRDLPGTGILRERVEEAVRAGAEGTVRGGPAAGTGSEDRGAPK